MRLLNRAVHLRWRRHLSAYLDGRLEPPRRAALERHLARCSFCQEELAGLRGVVALLHRVPRVEAPRSFALSHAPSTAMPWPALYVRPIRYVTAAAAMLLMAVVIGDLVTGRPSGTSSAGPGVAETTTAPAAGALQDLGQAQATPSPQPLPFMAAEKALETTEAEVTPSASPAEPGILYNWVQRVELGLGGILAALVGVVSVQWWLGRRRRQC